MEKVDYPRLWPTACALCRGQKGPMIDTMSEYPAAGPADSAGRFYICRSCVKQLALIFGFAKGPELAKLIDAQDIVEEVERQQKERDEMIHDLIEQLKVKDAMIKAQDGQLESIRARNSQLEHIAKQVQQTAKELVG